MNTIIDNNQSARCAWLTDALAGRFPVRKVSVWPYREGVDCWVDLVQDNNQPFAVVRTAKFELLNTRYEGTVDFRDTIEKEIRVAELLAEANVPTPSILANHLRSFDQGSGDRTWAVYTFIPHERNEKLDPNLHFQLGEITARIHAIIPDPMRQGLVRTPSDWENYIVKRILLRVEAARKYMTLPNSSALFRRLTQVFLGRGKTADRLLHLDLRGPNLAVVDGHVSSILDLSNAIVGDPFLELARLRSSNLLTPEFLRGYGLDIEPESSSDMLLDAYELDISALLVVVSREEFTDLALHSAMKERTRYLMARLALDACESSLKVEKK